MASRKPSLKHPSHSHPLHSHKAQVEEEIICSGCNLALIGAAFECTKPECDFVLHKSCFALKPEICHKAHPNHPLTLLYSTYYKASAYQCNACGEYGSGFVYNCSICKYDLHVGCEAMPKSVKREDHAHPLKLLYHSPYKNCRIFNCGVCEETVRDRYWCYYCKECDYGTHLLDCTVKEEDEEEEDEVEEEERKRGRSSNGENKGGIGSSGSGASELATMFEAQSEMENMKIDIHMEMQRAKTTRKAKNVGLK